MRSVAIALLPAAMAGCAVDVSLEGKRCPCSEGYVCDEVADRCVLTICTPRLSIADFGLEWATPNTVYYRWAPAGEPADFLRYDIVLAENEEDLASRTGTARVIGPDQSPDLASFDAVPTEGGGLVDRTMVRDLTPGTFYVARIFATDVAQCAFATPVFATRTQDDATATLELFEDELAPGAYLAPQEGFEVENGELVYTPSDDMECAQVPGGDPTCGQPLRVQGLTVVASQTGPETPGMLAETFPQAFLEVEVQNQGIVHSFASEVSIRPGDCTDSAEVYELAGFTLAANDTYQVVQVPLSVLRREADGAPFTFDLIDMLGAGGPVCGVAIGAQWNKTGQVNVDYFRIRY